MRDNATLGAPGTGHIDASATSTMTLPSPAERAFTAGSARAEPSGGAPKRLHTTPILLFAVMAAAIALGLAGWQITRAMNGESRLSVITMFEVGAAVVAVVCLLAWTWTVVENARRLLSTAIGNDPPSPSTVVGSWLMPVTVAIASIASIAFLERRLNPPDADVTSPVPLALACVALIVTLCVSYRPLFVLSAIMRRIGGGVGDLARWVWVPTSLVVVGGLTLFGLRAGGTYGEDFEGVAPAWALGVVFIPPVIIVLMLGWRGGRAVEDAVHLAFDRRDGTHAAGIGRGDIGMFARALRADARPPIDRDLRKHITLVPGAGALRLAMTIACAALTLISIVGALVMFLFWREASDGALLASQRERAWDALTGLQSLERLVAMGVCGVAMVWSFLNVTNARLASGRRRNPLLAALAWPAAAYAIWAIADRYPGTDEIQPLVTRFALQAAALYLPFFLLERTAVAVGARRGPLRLSYGLGVVLLVHIQGLGGLATLGVDADVDQFGRIAGYLTLAALLELITTLSITEVSHLIGDAAVAVADKHNFLADQRNQIDDRVTPSVEAPKMPRSPALRPPSVGQLSDPLIRPPDTESIAQPVAVPAGLPPLPAAASANPPPAADAVLTPPQAGSTTPGVSAPPDEPQVATAPVGRPDPDAAFDPSKPLSSIPPLVYRPAASPAPTTIAAAMPPPDPER